MAPCARRKYLDRHKIQVFHCYTRTVRRAYLCGRDRLTGNDYEHRRLWVRGLLELLAGTFAIEVGFHASMSNHLHIVIRTRPDAAKRWSDEKVVRNWLKIAKVKRGSEDCLWEPTEEQVQKEMANPQRVKKLRKRLSSVSWYMGTICENIARRANAEDDARGRFWEQRFKLRKLENVKSIVIAGTYVDLNEFRAGEVLTPEESRYTSLYERIEGLKARRAGPPPGASEMDLDSLPDRWLCKLTLEEGPDADVQAGQCSSTPWRASDKGLVPISIEDYLTLVDTIARQRREGKPGVIPKDLAPILERLEIDPDTWSETLEEYGSLFN